MAIRFDAARLEADEAPVMALPRLATAFGMGVFDLTDDGTLVYVEAQADDTTACSLVWVDRQAFRMRSAKNVSRPALA